MRAVVDTNVLVSAVLSAGSPYRIYLAWLDHQFELVISPALMAELERVVARRRISRRIQWSDDRINAFFEALKRRATWVHPGQPIDVLNADPADNRVLEAAVEGKVDYIVTGDRALLELGEYEGIHIVTPAHFAAILVTQAQT